MPDKATLFYRAADFGGNLRFDARYDAQALPAGSVVVALLDHEGGREAVCLPACTEAQAAQFRALHAEAWRELNAPAEE